MTLICVFTLITGCKTLGGSNCIPPKASGGNSWSPTQAGTAGFLTNMATSFANLALNITLGPPAGQSGSSANIVEQAFTNFVSSKSFVERDFTKGMVYSMYISLTQSSTFQAIYYLGLIAFITFLGLSYTMGLKEITLDELYKTLFKVAIISMFTNPSLLSSSGTGSTAAAVAKSAGTIGWQTYFTLIVSPLLFATEWLGKVLVASIYGVDISQIYSPFVAIDAVLHIFGDGDTWIKIVSVLFTGSIAQGLILLISFLLGVITLILSTAHAIIIYAAALLVMSVLLAMGPLFIICAMFKHTENMFQKWYKNLIGLAIQQYIVFLILTLFCVIGQAMLESLLYFASCPQPIISLKFSVPWPDWLRSAIRGIISVANSFGMGIDDPTSRDILNMSVPLLTFFVASLFGGASAILTPANKIFQGLELFIFSLVMMEVITRTPDFGKAIAGSDISATKAAGTAGQMAKALHGMAVSSAVGATKAIVTGHQFKIEEKEDDGMLTKMQNSLKKAANAVTGGIIPEDNPLSDARKWERKQTKRLTKKLSSLVSGKSDAATDDSKPSASTAGATANPAGSSFNNGNDPDANGQNAALLHQQHPHLPAQDATPQASQNVYAGGAYGGYMPQSPLNYSHAGWTANTVAGRNHNTPNSPNSSSSSSYGGGVSNDAALDAASPYGTNAAPQQTVHMQSATQNANAFEPGDATEPRRAGVPSQPASPQTPQHSGPWSPGVSSASSAINGSYGNVQQQFADANAMHQQQ